MDFKRIWEDQKVFNSKLVNIDEVAKNLQDKRTWNNFYCLALHREIGELLETIDWKIHRKERKQPVKTNTLEELVDCLKYWISLAQLHGFTPEEIEEEYFRKSAVVEQIHRQEISENIANTPGRKVVGVDIDGVLCDYVGGFLDFINRERGTNYQPDSIKSSNIYEYLNMPLEEAIALKDKYRQTGQKRYLPVCDEATYFLRWLQRKGYAIVLLTARPYMQYKRIFADTMEWLKENDLIYDMVLFEEKKEEALINQFGPEKIEFFVEDMPSNANKIAGLGVPCYLINQPYNQEDNLHPLAKRVNDLREVIIDAGNVNKS